MENGTKYERFRRFINSCGMISERDLVVAGVSGGVDSMVMLDLLIRFQRECTFSLSAVHVHHGIREEEADRDERYVKEFCAKKNIPFYSVHFNIPELAGEWRMGEEEAGRIVRQRAFAEMAERLRGDRREGQIKIAIAHHEEDRSETILWNLARGSSLRGLGAMPPISGNRIRPVLFLNRQEILEYAKEQNIPYGTDSTNQEDEYTRNRIRHHVLPYLNAQVNTQAGKHIADTADLLAEYADYMEYQARELLGRCKREDRYLLGKDVEEAHPALKKETIYFAMAELLGRRRDLQAVHVNAVLELFGKNTGKRASLPDGIFAMRTSEGILLGKCCDRGRSDEPGRLQIPGVTCCESGHFTCRVFLRNGEEIPQNKYTKWMDYDTITTELYVRIRQENDYMVIRADGRKKKLNRIFIDDKVPAVLRDEMPLVAAGDEILWIVGGRMSERYKVKMETIRVLEISYEGGKNNERTY